VPTPLDPASNDMRAEDFTFDLLAANHRTTGPDNIEAYTYGQDNQLTSLALATPLTTAEDFTYSYDYENRLTGVVKVAGGLTTTVTFKYDPFGRRIQKRVQTTQNGQNVVNVFIYVYDKEDVILERESTTIGGGAPTVTVKKYVHGPGVDEPLAVAKGNSVYYYHADGVGSVVAMTNNTEATVEGYTYETFGKFQRFGNAVMNTYGFTGREYDAETGLYYYRARYYDPETGRFISKDPIGFAGGDANQYNYVQGDPVNWGDPWGLAVGDWWDIPANLTRARQIAGEELDKRPNSHNDIDDAMRHAEWMRRTVQDTNNFTAWLAGTGHEIEGLLKRQPWHEMLMDLHNNSVGRSVGRNNSSVDSKTLWTLPLKGSSQYNPYSKGCGQ